MAVDTTSAADLPDALRKHQKLLGSSVERDFIAFSTASTYDERYDSMWGMIQIQAAEALALVEENPNVLMGVIDTGTDVTHPDLVDRIWVHPREIPGNGIDDDGDGYVDGINGWDVQTDTGVMVDVDGHGTHVGGTMAATANNEIGVVGVGAPARLVAFGAGNSFSSSTAQSLDYLTYLSKAFGYRVASSNHSYGALRTNPTFFSSTRRAAIARSRDIGTLFVAAAGNDGQNTGPDQTGDHVPSSQNVADYPSVGDYDSVISVAASNNETSKLQ